jgi:hypothetical protein
MQWTTVANGTSCGSGMVCNSGACASQCFIGGTVYASGASDQGNACQTCQPSASTSAWTEATDGTQCGTGGICHVGSCVSGCEIGGVYYATSALNPNNPCQTCQPGTSLSAWSNLSNGTACGNGQVCASGSCGNQCDIGGTIYGSNATNPTNACQSCQPGTSTTTWTVVANGTGCGSGEICNAAACAPGCFIGGTIYASGAANPTNACQSCQPGTSATAWTAVATGTSCGSGEICESANCESGCFIGGTTYAPGAANPANACQSCQPLSSTTGWIAVPDGTVCGSGQTCTGGTCQTTGPVCPTPLSSVPTSEVPPYVAAQQMINACTAAQMTAYFTACVNAGATQPTCTAWYQDATNATCAGCINPATNSGALVTDSVSQYFNEPGCIALADPVNGPACAQVLQTDFECQDVACADCVGASASDQDQCYTSAGAGACASYGGSAGSLCSAEFATDAGAGIECESPQFIVNEFCGTGM